MDLATWCYIFFSFSCERKLSVAWLKFYNCKYMHTPLLSKFVFGYICAYEWSRAD